MFFPSLIEQCQREGPSTPFPSDCEVRNSLNQFMEWLQRCLTAPLTQISDATTRTTENINTVSLVAQFTQYINLSTDSGLTPSTNPLAQHRIIDALDKTFTINSETDTQLFIDTIEKQFNASAEGFYSQLNRFCGCYFSMSSDSLTRRELPKPTVCLDSDIEITPPTPAPSILDAEEAIQYIKTFIEVELSLGKVDARFHSLGKRIAIPIINYSLAMPEALVTSDTKHPLKQLLLTVKNIAQHCHAYNSPQSYKLATQAEITLKHFIDCAMEGSININDTLLKLAPIAAQCKKPQTNTVTPTPDTPTPETEPKPKQVTAPTKAPLVLINNTKVINKEDHNTATSKNKNNAYSSIQEQACHMVKTLLLDADKQNSLAAKLQHEWQKTLESVGNRHGTRSKAWEQAIEQFIELTHYESINALPLPLAQSIEKQLRAAGFRNTLISRRAQAPAIDAQYAVILKEGNWFDYERDGRQIRCKLAAIIKQIGRYIFISRQGQKVLEIDYLALKKQLINGGIKPCSRVSLNNTLEDVLANIKHAQAQEFELDY
ncbi:hypothetical protein MARGE09_P0630 [Marinagarivorans cellulosilyticus]|uniref:DUF1631 family protein n=1 Tax=Marinagarivorans cellulosilyticus TaxID=2721545 RepID=A0AAN1WF35_9GAMM|nr:hypothetical protein MARGE09_P0630 [Marinagarivorans cellulosilyticus]